MGLAYRVRRPHRRAKGAWIALISAALALACSPVPTPSDSASASTSFEAAPGIPEKPIALNPIESRVATALGALGITAVRAEGSVTGAVLSATFGDGSELFVNAVPKQVDHSEFAVVAERQLNGLAVKRVAYAFGAMRDRFGCDELVVEVEGEVPPGYAGMDPFLADLIASLDCSG